MRRRLWSKEAAQDLRTILTWLRGQNRVAALKAEVEILQMIHSISLRPMAGRYDSETDVLLRSLPRWHLRIAYKVQDEDIYLVHIQDTRRQPE